MIDDELEDELDEPLTLWGRIKETPYLGTFLEAMYYRQQDVQESVVKCQICKAPTTIGHKVYMQNYTVEDNCQAKLGFLCEDCGKANGVLLWDMDEDRKRDNVLFLRIRLATAGVVLLLLYLYFRKG